jgi:hypothetical protein
VNVLAVYAEDFEIPTSYAKHLKDFSRRMLNPNISFTQYLFSEHLAFLIWTFCEQ